MTDVPVAAGDARARRNEAACRIISRLDDEILTSPRKWGRGEWKNELTGRMCLLGGLREAYDKERSFGSLDRTGVYVYLQEEVLGQINLRQRSLRQRQFASTSSIVRFNDDLHTHFKDIKAVIKGVRERVCVKP